MLKELFRYLLVGGFNTLISYSLYLLLLPVLPYLLAFTSAYIISIFTSYLLQTKFVFKKKVVLASALKFPMLYIYLYFMNTGLIYICVNFILIDEVLAPIMVLVLTVPIGFKLSSIIIKNTKNRDAT